MPNPKYNLSTIQEHLKGINPNKLYPVLREKGYLVLNKNGHNITAPKYRHTHFFLLKKATYTHKATGFDVVKPQIFATKEGLELLKRDYLNGDFIMKKDCVIQPFETSN